MNKICTTIEQSKKLIELGIDVNTADMHYSTWTILNGEYILSPNQGETIEELQEDYGNQVIPAWSLTALLDMLDYEVVDAEGESCYLKIDKDDIEYQIRYEDRWNSGIETKWYDNLLDAAFEMILKLKEKGLL